MEHFEYKVIPAPRRGVRTKGAKGPAGRFAGALENAINELAATGWEYVRAESLPTDERIGLAMRKTESYQNVLIFRRPADASADTPPVTAFDEDQTDDDDETEELFEDINDDFPEEDAAEVEEDTSDDSHEEETEKT